MILVDQDNKISNLMETLGVEIGLVKLDIPTFELSNVNKDELYMVDAEAFAQQDSLDKCNQCSHIIVHDPESKLSNLCNGELPKNVIFVYESEKQKDVLKNLVQNTKVLYLENEMMRGQLVSLNAELNEALSLVETQLLRVKEFHHKNIPVRSWEGKGINLYMRYAAGSGNGNEFIDFYTSDDQLVIFINRSNSYLISSSILANYSDFKAKNSTDLASVNALVKNIEIETEKVNKELDNIELEVELLLMTIDLKTKRCHSFSIGGHHLITSTGEKFIGKEGSLPAKTECDEFEFSLDRNQRLIIVSTGFWKNWLATNRPFKIDELITNTEIKIEDVLDELLYQLKKDKEGSFIATDACSVLLEVNENAIIELH